MLDIQAALTAARVPAYRAAFRSRSGQKEPPDAYCVYTCTSSQDWPSDDRNRITRIRAFLHLYSRNSPLAHQAALALQMDAQGFRLLRQTEGYDDGADLYEVLSEWEGIRNEV